jgi:hypothetical protein
MTRTTFKRLPFRQNYMRQACPMLSTKSELSSIILELMKSLFLVVH